MHRGFVVAALVLLAGCSAVPFGSDGTPALTDTVTPVAVTDSPTPEPTVFDDRPQGVAPNGTVDADVLVRAHTERLANLTYTWVLRYDAGDGDNEGYVRRVVVGNGTFFVTQAPEGPGTNASMYVNESGGFLRSMAPQGTRYELIRVPGEADDYAFATGSIQQFLDDRTVSVSPVERRGRTYYRLYGAGGPAPGTLGPAEATISDYTVTAYVAPDGFVRSLAVEYDRTVDGDSSHVTVRYDYSRLGESVPTPPDWIAEVPRRSTPEPVDPDGTDGTDTPDVTDAPDRTDTPDRATVATASEGTPTDDLDGPIATPDRSD